MQSYTPFAGQMGASLAGTMPTLGNRQAVQQQEQISLAQLLESYKQARERGQLGQQMQNSEFVQGSGALGALAQMAQAYMGGKVRRKAGESAVELAERITRAQTEAEQSKAMQAQQAKIAEQQQLMDARRQAFGNDQEMFALTGDVAKPARGIPMMTDQGLVFADPETKQYQLATPQGQPQTVNNPIPAPPPGGLDFAQLRALVEKQESGGNPNAVSPKGAVGRMQTMPTTLTDPGFGIQPARDRSDAEMTRVGNEYLSAMLNKYGDQRLALAAYNWGPGNVDNALKRSGGDVNAVLAGAPAETRGYVQNILGGQQPQGQPRPNAPLRPYEKPAAAGDLEKRLALAQQMGATPEEQRQLVLGRDAAAAGAKPMPTSALRMIQEETNAANGAQAITTSINKHLGRIKNGKLDFGPIANKINEGRNYAGASTEQSRNYQEFRSDLEKLRNDSLRLNAGVQTDGDAQRAWNELFANLNDTAYVKQRLETINELNKRAESLRRLNIDMVRENFGKGGEQSAPAANGGWSIEKVP